MHVSQGESIVEIRIPGITFDISAPSDGTLIEITTTVDSSLQPGQILGYLGISE